MNILRKTEDIFKPVEPDELGARQSKAKEAYYKELNARTKRSLIDDLVSRDMDAVDDATVKDILIHGFKGYNHMDRDELIRIYEDYFGGWEDFL